MNGASKTPAGPDIKYTSGLLERNTIYSVVGQMLPMFVALLAVPYLIEGIGTDRFGLLTIAWIVVGYFGVFDMGVGRATTKLVAEYGARGGHGEIRDLVLSSLLLLCLFGILAGLLLAALTDWLVGNVLNTPAVLVPEARQSFNLLAAAIPFVLLIAGARGVLEAQQQFRRINFVKVPSAVATYVIPLLVLPFSTSLVPIVGMLALAKVITLLCYLYFCWVSLPKSDKLPKIKHSHVSQLLRFGGWLSVSNIISPMIGYADRFFIGAFLTMTAVAYYSTPFDVFTRLVIIPNGIMVVVFPAFSALFINDVAKLSQLYHRTIKYILFVMTPVMVAIMAFAHPLLHLWLGEEFAQNASLVVQILAVGMLLSSVARVPLNATQAMGRPDISAKCYLIQLPIVIAALYFLTAPLGIMGVALIFVVRIVVDAVILFHYGNKMLSDSPVPKCLGVRGMYAWVGTAILIGLSLSAIPDLVVRVACSLVLLSAGVAVVSAFFLDSIEKGKIAAVWHQISASMPGKAP